MSERAFGGGGGGALSLTHSLSLDFRGVNNQLKKSHGSVTNFWSLLIVIRKDIGSSIPQVTSNSHLWPKNPFHRI